MKSHWTQSDARARAMPLSTVLVYVSWWRNRPTSLSLSWTKDPSSGDRESRCLWTFNRRVWAAKICRCSWAAGSASSEKHACISNAGGASSKTSTRDGKVPRGAPQVFSFLGQGNLGKQPLAASLALQDLADGRNNRRGYFGRTLCREGAITPARPTRSSGSSQATYWP